MIPAPPTGGNAVLPPQIRSYRTTLVAYQRPGNGPNVYDGCLAYESQMWDDTMANGLSKVCCPKGRPQYRQRPWIAMPDGGRRFKPVGTLPAATVLASPAGTTFTVLSTYVPVGYDGVITDVVCEIVIAAPGVTGFQDGSGDITWRLSSDGRYLRDLGNITVTMGSLTSPSPVMRGGLRVYSHDLLHFDVIFGAGAAADIAPLSTIICSISGWFYPR